MIAPGAVFDGSNKRGAEDLAYMGMQADESMTKRSKPDNQTPTRTLHVRNLPQDVTEAELTALCAPFGRVVAVLLLRGKSQAFVELETVQQASQVVSYFSQVAANLRGRTAYFQYSTREAITTNQAPETPKPILLVSISNLIYPVTIDVLYSVFSKYGSVGKIVIFSKSAAFQALVQYVDINAAVNAKNALDGQNLYVGACTLRVQYSSLPQLTVKYNNDKSRDFLDPNLPPGPPGASSAAQQPPFFPQAGYPQQAYGYSMGYGDGSVGMPMGGMTGMPGTDGATVGGGGGGGGQAGTVIIVSNLNQERVTCDVLFALFGVYGDVQRVKILYNKKDNALIQMTTPEQAQAAMQHLNNAPLYGKAINVNQSKHTYVALPRPGTEQENAHLTKDFTNSPLHRFRSPTSKNALHITPPGTVLHIAGLPPSATEESVRMHFGAFGPINFKFMPKDRKQGLIQLADVAMTIEALIALHQQPFEGAVLKVSFSKATF